METERNDHCLATVTSTTFIPGTMVLIASFLQHNHWFKGDIVIIHDGLNSREKNLFNCFRNIQFLEVSDALKERLAHLAQAVPRRQLNHKIARFFSLESFRITGYRRVLFCDSDMLILDDLRELFDMTRENESHHLLCCGDRTHYFHTPRDMVTYMPLSTQEELQHSNGTFRNSFNSGFMLIDGLYTQPPHYQNMLDLLHPSIWENILSPLTDQIVLNIYFKERVKMLSGRYNFLLIFGNRILREEKLSKDDIKVVHYAGRSKPWDPLNVLHTTVDEPETIHYVTLWQNYFLDFLPRFHINYHFLNRTRPR